MPLTFERPVSEAPADELALGLWRYPVERVGELARVTVDRPLFISRMLEAGWRIDAAALAPGEVSSWSVRELARTLPLGVLDGMLRELVDLELSGDGPRSGAMSALNTRTAALAAEEPS